MSNVTREPMTAWEFTFTWSIWPLRSQIVTSVVTTEKPCLHYCRSDSWRGAATRSPKRCAPCPSGINSLQRYFKLGREPTCSHNFKCQCAVIFFFTMRLNSFFGHGEFSRSVRHGRRYSWQSSFTIVNHEWDILESIMWQASLWRRDSGPSRAIIPIRPKHRIWRSAAAGRVPDKKWTTREGVFEWSFCRRSSVFYWWRAMTYISFFFRRRGERPL